ncbi:hypothetical protein Q9Q99_10285 [Curtobacterium flaccumfaciens]|nr:hypothetical protein Q9Q99_10285 [Curtobacterium flaccumfaciens]
MAAGADRSTDTAAARNPWQRFWDRGGWWRAVLAVVLYLAVYEGLGWLNVRTLASDITADELFATPRGSRRGRRPADHRDGAAHPGLRPHALLGARGLRSPATAGAGVDVDRRRPAARPDRDPARRDQLVVVLGRRGLRCALPRSVHRVLPRNSSHAASP